MNATLEQTTQSKMDAACHGLNREFYGIVHNYLPNWHMFYCLRNSFPSIDRKEQIKNQALSEISQVQLFVTSEVTNFELAPYFGACLLGTTMAVGWKYKLN